MSAAAPPKRRKNSSKDVTRGQLLATAREMMVERGFDTALSLRLTDVTKRAGMTTGSAYQVWLDGQPEFHLDLAKYLIDSDARKGADAVADAAAPAFTDGLSLYEVIEFGAAGQ
jgi:AcrR family transcriptional regulator